MSTQLRNRKALQARRSAGGRAAAAGVLAVAAATVVATVAQADARRGGCRLVQERLEAFIESAAIQPSLVQGIVQARPVVGGWGGLQDVLGSLAAAARAATHRAHRCPPTPTPSGCRARWTRPGWATCRR